MSAPVLTVFADAAPCPRVEVFFPSFDAGTVSVTVYRSAGGRERQVRGAVRAPTGGTFTRIDFEVPFNEVVSYRAEQFDAAGVSLGFTPSSSLGDFYSPWVEVRRNLALNPLTGASIALTGGSRGTITAADGGARLTINDALVADRAQRVAQESGNAIPVTAGAVVSISAELGASSRAGQTFVLAAYFQDASNAVVGSTVVSPVVSPSVGAFQRVALENLSVPAGATKLAWQAAVSGTLARSVGDTFAVRRVLVEVSAVAGEFFSGDSTSTATQRFVWTAGVNSSPSAEERRTVLGVGVPSDETWMHNPLDPQGSVRVFFGDDSSWKVTRPTPGEVSYPKGRRVGVVLSEPRRGVVGLELVVRTSTEEDADRVQVMCGDSGMPPVLCVRLGLQDRRLRLPQPLFLSALSVSEVDMDTRWGGSELAHMVNGDEVDPPIPGLFVPLLRAKDINVSFATAAAVNAAHLRASDVNRRYDLAGAAG